MYINGFHDLDLSVYLPLNNGGGNPSPVRVTAFKSVHFSLLNAVGNNLGTAVRGGLEGLVAVPPDPGCGVSPHQLQFATLEATVSLQKINSPFKLEGVKSM